MDKKIENVINVFSINDFNGVVETIGLTQQNSYECLGLAMFSKHGEQII